ncbi:MAG: hypothetical protein R2709_10905 [Marmoricola sp.]
MVKTHLNPGLEISTILITMFDSRTNLAAGAAAEVTEHFEDQVLPDGYSTLCQGVGSAKLWADT